VVLQAYRNDSSTAIEAKYVFPLDDTAAVCGFEAFINGKHVIGIDLKLFIRIAIIQK
jgi:poly [ADP-ribose] polymerase